jgi:UDP-2,3-diacylglucosamine pyrophosphatase LpxH
VIDRAVSSGKSVPPGSPRESLLVFSDVHLGSDLNDRLAGEVIRRSSRIDADLAKLLRYYALQKPKGDRWRVVIAGDFIDFIGMAIEPDREDAAQLTHEEREHGLGNSSEHACIKLRRVAERHVDVFQALAAFVAQGHALTVVHGNHDVEFYWDDVKKDFRQLLLRHATASGAVDRDAFEGRIEFHPWFFFWGSVAYIEHGHQYDPFCALDHVMAPLSALDPRRVARGFSDTLLRFVVRPTKGMREHGHDTAGITDYLAFAARLGVSGMVALSVRFVRAILELFRLRREYFSKATETLRQEHERQKALLAEATRIGIDRIRALAALQVPPLTRSIRGILASLLLDRLALGLLAASLFVASALLCLYRAQFSFAGLAVVAAWLVAHRYLSRQRQIDPAEALSTRAGHLAKLLPAAFIVMGHTHTPKELPINNGASTYINLGSWSEEEPSESSETYTAPRTHLVIHMENGTPKANLLAWDSETGPVQFGEAAPKKA